MFSKCRACLSLGDNLKYLSKTEPEGKKLIMMFTSVVNVEWLESDQIAPFLCKECESTLELSYAFKKKSEESHKILTKLLENDESDSLKGDGEIGKQRKGKSPREGKIRIKRFSEEEVNKAVTEYKNKQNSGLGCIACGYTLTTLRALSTHMTQMHKDIRANWCYACNKTYTNLSEHQLVHKKSVEKCQFCDKFVKKKYFIEHLHLHSGVKPYECHTCGRGFLTNSSLKVHHKHHKERGALEEEKKIETENIEEIKTNSINLPHHINKADFKIKNEPRTFFCQICNKEYRSNCSLQVHLRLHRGEILYKCSYCDRPHKSRAQMKDHERIHTGEKPYVCNVCGKAFTQSGALSTHMKQHTGRPELCKICQKRFCRPSELKLHLRKHSGEKPYLCTDCGKTFVQKSHLTEHMKTHSDDRPHQCNYCEKAFKQKSLLTSHLQIHAGLKNFKCTICSYACFKSYRLQQHMKLHNNELKDFGKVHVCPICQKRFASVTLLNAHKSALHNAIV